MLMGSRERLAQTGRGTKKRAAWKAALKAKLCASLIGAARPEPRRGS